MPSFKWKKKKKQKTAQKTTKKTTIVKQVWYFYHEFRWQGLNNSYTITKNKRKWKSKFNYVFILRRFYSKSGIRPKITRLFIVKYNNSVYFVWLKWQNIYLKSVSCKPIRDFREKYILLSSHQSPLSLSTQIKSVAF